MNELKMKKNSIKNDDGGWHVIDSDAEIRQIDQQINDLKYSINHLKNQK